MVPLDVLVIDDDPDVRKILVHVLKREGYTLREADTGEAGLDAVQQSAPDLVLLDLNLPDMSGMEVLDRIIKTHDGIRVVMITGEGDIATAVQAMKLGAADFLPKPLEIQKLKFTISALLREDSGQSGVVSRSILGISPQMAEVWVQVNRYAHPDVSVLLRGESGTGKELFARTLHERSKRRDGPFVALDCATLPDTLVESELFGHEKGAFTGAMERKIGRFEMAQGGTIFLDEIGNLPLHFQAKLLRVIEERSIDRLGGNKPVPVDVRILSATNLDLEHALHKGTFREDLYYRLAEVVIALPPLRSREGDVQMLTKHFIEEFNHRFGRHIQDVSEEAARILGEYRWPGNVRELKNALKSSLLASDDLIRVEHLPEYLRRVETPAPADDERDGKSLRQRIGSQVGMGLQNGFMDLKSMVAGYSEEIEQVVLTELLNHGRYTQRELCDLLNINPKTLRAKLQKFRLTTRAAGPKFF
jgi:DNA-binding NtrC family response regulator